MNKLTKLLMSLFLCTAVLAFSGFSTQSTLRQVKRVSAGEVTRHIALLKSRDAQQKAAAAYWLGSQHSFAASAIDSLAALLGDKTEVDTSRYRESRDETSARLPRKLTVGEEAALALVNIGRASTDALIDVLKSSPEPHARKNAAWALGAIREGAVSDGPPEGTVNQTRQWTFAWISVA